MVEISKSGSGRAPAGQPAGATRPLPMRSENRLDGMFNALPTIKRTLPTLPRN